MRPPPDALDHVFSRAGIVRQLNSRSAGGAPLRRQVPLDYRHDGAAARWRNNYSFRATRATSPPPRPMRSATSAPRAWGAALSSARARRGLAGLLLLAPRAPRSSLLDDVVLLLQEARRGATRRGAVRVRPPRAPWPRWTPPAPVRPRRRLLLLDPDPVLPLPSSAGLGQRGARSWGEGGSPVWRGRSSLTYSKFFGKKSKLPLTLLTFFGVSFALSSS